ncbi:hypothetical protein [Microbispora triticiradicis]|uniref:hypothetical protein n=1 Tax=Microbispora triticiradicis TaxID=2200763 RepID=UPI001AD71B82|nr:hypothetical protein [Microbispora triticiradicis]MBO4273120.1 hypothetical protein [Microbispora triticiradicis]
MLTVAAILLVAVVATLALGLCKAAGRPRPTPPPLHHEMRFVAALHDEAEHLMWGEDR